MSRTDDDSGSDDETESRDWGPWALVGGVALVGVAAVARGAKKRLEKSTRRE